jgi:hypothetical protein
MPNPLRRSVRSATGPLVHAVLLLCVCSLTARQAIGQDTATPPTAIEKVFGRIDLAISGAGNFSSSVSGVEKRDAATTHSVLKIAPSSTVGELFTLRYIAKPFVGFQFNFSNARLTQNYTFTPPPSTNVLLGGAQTTAREISLGYVAHLHKVYGIAPFAGAGFGTLHFTPTPGGGQGLPFQYRAVYYYDAGLDYTFPQSHFGARLAFRQLIYLAPDFGQNYLTITRRTLTSEPAIGFFLRF